MCVVYLYFSYGNIDSKETSNQDNFSVPIYEVLKYILFGITRSDRRSPKIYEGSIMSCNNEGKYVRPKYRICIYVPQMKNWKKHTT